MVCFLFGVKYGVLFDKVLEFFFVVVLFNLDVVGVLFYVGFFSRNSDVYRNVI